MKAPLLLLTVMAVLAVSPAGAAAVSGHALDLASANVDGHRILGRTIAGVTAALGRPDYRAGKRLSYKLRWGARPNFSIEVMFRPVAGVERAWPMAFEHGLHDVKLGDLLGLSSPALQGAILKSYGDSFKLVRPYKCKAKICVGEFAQRTGSPHIGFGTQPTLDTWLTVWQGPTA